MTVEQEDKYSLILKVFDELKLDTMYHRRTAVKPLHDYYMQLIRDVGTNLCDINEKIFNVTSLLSRWINVKNFLEDVTDPKSWDQTIHILHNMRNDVDHSDSYDPSERILLEVRKQAPIFKDWIIKVSHDYYLQSKNFTLKDTFYTQSMNYIPTAEYILEKFGENTPYVVRDDLILLEDTYQQIPFLKNSLEDRVQSSEFETIEVSDLKNLINLVKIISKLEGKEEMLIRSYICPKCGAKITETQDYYGGNEDDPKPDGVYTRVGCEKCDYTIHTDSISL